MMCMDFPQSRDIRKRKVVPKNLLNLTSDRSKELEIRFFLMPNNSFIILCVLASKIFYEITLKSMFQWGTPQNIVVHFCLYASFTN